MTNNACKNTCVATTNKPTKPLPPRRQVESELQAVTKKLDSLSTKVGRMSMQDKDDKRDTPKQLGASAPSQVGSGPISTKARRRIRQKIRRELYEKMGLRSRQMYEAPSFNWEGYQDITTTVPSSKITTIPNPTVTTFTPTSTYPLPGTTDTGYKALTRRLMAAPAPLSKDGMEFLMCAFAPTDFANMSIQGVPDEIRAPSLVKQHRAVFSTAVDEVNDQYFLLAPVPGIAYFQATVARGTPIITTTQFQAVPYSDFMSLFGNNIGTAADIVTKFRFISNHIEFIPTVNQMSWSGNIQAFKMPVSVEIRQGGTGPAVTDLWGVTGLQGCNSNLQNQYTAPFNLGVYTAAYSATGKFEYCQIVENVQAIPSAITITDFGQLQAAPTVPNLPGFDNGFESVLIKVTGVTAPETMLIKTWACVEYQVQTNSALYQYQTISPTDILALDLYRDIKLALPVGVSYTENASFWSRVLDVIKSISGGLVTLPGPYGAIARGVNLTATGLQQFTDNSRN